LDFPFDIVNETSTVSLVALEISFSTVGNPTPTANNTGNNTLTYLSSYTWEVNGKVLYVRDYTSVA
jgi:hypothetical protein